MCKAVSWESSRKNRARVSPPSNGILGLCTDLGPAPDQIIVVIIGSDEGQTLTLTPITLAPDTATEGNTGLHISAITGDHS